MPMRLHRFISQSYYTNRSVVTRERRLYEYYYSSPIAFILTFSLSDLLPSTLQHLPTTPSEMRFSTTATGLALVAIATASTQSDILEAKDELDITGIVAEKLANNPKSTLLPVCELKSEISLSSNQLKRTV
jgi:hypothetical protein